VTYIKFLLEVPITILRASNWRQRTTWSNS